VKRKIVIGVLVFVGVLVALVLTVCVGGAMLPADHVASGSATLAAPPQAVYDAIADFEGQTSWNKAVSKVEKLPDHEGHAVWKELTGFGPIKIERLKLDPATKTIVHQIADPDLPFGGTWTYEIAADGANTKLTITENGTVKSAPFRFLSRYVFGYTATIDAYLKALAGKFGAK